MHLSNRGGSEWLCLKVLELFDVICAKSITEHFVELTIGHGVGRISQRRQNVGQLSG